MIITRLNIQHFRNLHEVSLDCHPQFNVFFGENGSGKTSLLEAVYFLSHGRSFRSNLLNRIISHGKPHFSLFVEVQTETAKHHIGMQRSAHEESKTRLDGKNLNSHIEIAKCVPTLLFNPESFSLLTAGSKGRRQLMDWGVFYQKAEFIHIWQEARKSLKQRNAALRAGHSKKDLGVWLPAFIEASEKIDYFRKTYVEALIQTLESLIGEFLQKHRIHIHYYRGWTQDEPLESCLERSLEQDQKHGLTHYGPHRADIKVKIGNQPAEEILSRGQQKTLICALKIAQGILYKQQTGKACIYLLDDIASELDQNHLNEIMGHLRNLGSQVFMSSIQEDALSTYLLEDEFTKFALSQGAINHSSLTS
ncbi:MAG: replication/repair protein RecF [Gammaproteobacteria bacterium]|jgi:DNA replication and repair protein RecF|nr:replication/repair protein RecF [Gammaproteobacteria bacterium]